MLWIWPCPLGWYDLLTERENIMESLISSSYPPPEAIGVFLVVLLLALLSWPYLRRLKVRPQRHATPQDLPKETDVSEPWAVRAEAARYLTDEEEGREPASGARVTHSFLYQPSDEEVGPPPLSLEHALIGRDEELEEVIGALKERKTILLWGTEGIGRTFLASWAAYILKQEFTDGILWLETGKVPLSAIASAVARSLGNHTIPTLSSERRLGPTKDLLSSRDMLIVLDEVGRIRAVTNFIQHCLPKSIALMAIGSAPFQGFDLVKEVRPLSYQSSIELFQEQGGLLGPEGGTVREIYGELGGHPLALSLMAALVRAEKKGLEELKGKLRAEKADLRAPANFAPQVWMALSASFGELTSEEKRVLTSLSAFFAGSGSCELIATLCDMEEEQCREILRALGDYGLVKAIGRRYRLHPLVRRFGQAMLGEELRQVEGHLVSALLGYVAHHSQDGPGSFVALEAELGNILGAMDHSYARADWGTLLGFMEAIGRPVTGFLGVKGYWDEITKYGRLALSAAQGMGDEPSMAHYLSSIGMIQLNRGNYSEAKRRYREALEIFKRLGSRKNMAVVLQQLGRAAQDTGDCLTAQRLYRACLRVRRELNDREGMAMTLWALGNMAMEGGKAEEANERYEQSMAIFRELGDKRSEAGILHQLGLMAQQQGDYPRARQLYRESLRLKKDLGDQRGTATSLHNLAAIAEALGDYAEARRLYQESLSVARRFGDRKSAAATLHELGDIAQHQGDHTRAQALSRESMELQWELGDEAGIAANLDQLGQIAYLEGRYDEAEGFLTESLDLKQKLDDKLGVGGCLHQLGNIAYQGGDYPQAERLYQESLALTRELASESMVSANLDQLGSLASKRGEYFQANRLYRESLGLKEKLGDRAGVARTLHQMGNVAYRQGYYAEAKRLYNRSLELRRALGDRRGMARTLHQLGNVDLAQGHYLEAKELYQESLKLRRETGDRQGTGVALAQMSLLEERLGNWREAYDLVKDATAILRETKAQELYERALNNLRRLERLLSQGQSLR